MSLPRLFREALTFSGLIFLSLSLDKHKFRFIHFFNKHVLSPCSVLCPGLGPRDANTMKQSSSLPIRVWEMTVPEADRCRGQRLGPCGRSHESHLVPPLHRLLCKQGKSSNWPVTEGPHLSNKIKRPTLPNIL